MLKALMVVVLTAAFMVTAHAKNAKQTGTIIKVDDAAKTFMLWGGKDITYKTTDKTVFRASGKDGTLADLKRGSAGDHSLPHRRQRPGRRQGHGRKALTPVAGWSFSAFRRRKYRAASLRSRSAR